MTDNETKDLLKRIAVAVEMLAGVRTSPASDLADDRDLDGKFGDPEVKFNPRDWHGDSCKGLRMSECPAEFLDLLAGTFDYFAKQAEQKNETTNAGKPVAPYKRKDAARARGWAARKRNAPAPAANASPFESFGTSGFTEDIDAEIAF